MKHTILKLLKISLLSLILIFTACNGGGEKLSNCYYQPVISDSTHVLSAKNKVFFTNFQFPADLVPVVVTAESVSPTHIASFADEVFDSIADHSVDRHAFERRGLLLVVTRSPELIQLRVGKGYELYTRMKGATSGFDYLTLQKEIATQGIDSVFPKFVPLVVDEVLNYRALSWYHKIRINSGVQFIYNFLKDAGSPSDSFFDQVYFEPFLFLLSFLCGITGSWFISFLVIIALVWGISYIVKRIIKKKVHFSDNPQENAKFILIINDFVQIIISLIISFPTLAAITVLSNARMEDSIVLQSANIPYAEIIDWSNSSHTAIPSVILILLLGLVFYMRYICKYDILLIAPLSSEIQQNCCKKGLLYVDALNQMITGGVMRNVFYNILLNAINPNQDEPQDSNSYNDDTLQKELDKHLFYTIDSDYYHQKPCSAIISNRHIEACFFCSVLMICACTLCTTAIALYFLVLWSISLCARILKILKTYKWLNDISGNRLNSFLDIKGFWSKKLLVLLLLFLLSLGILMLTNPYASVQRTEVINIETIDRQMLLGLYDVKSVGGQKPEEGVSAEIKSNDGSHFYLYIYSNKPTQLYELTYDSTAYTFQSSLLGYGRIEYLKDIDMITIKFDKGWIISK